MELTRRGLLGIGASVGVAGCLSAGGSNVSYPETPTDVALAEAEAAAESERASAAGTEDEPPRETDSSAPNPRLAAELERVYGGIEWFATDYDDAVDTYRRVLGKAVATVERVRDRAAFDDGSLGLVRGATDRAVAVAERELGDHFGIADLMREEVDGHLATIRRFADRGDLDRVDEELERLGEYLAGIRSELFVRRVLSDRQIDAELYRHLHDRTVDPADDGDGDDEPDPGLFELYHDTGYAGYAYAGSRYVERDPFGDDADDDGNEGRELLARQRVAFDPVGEATDRTGYAYVVSYAVPDEPAQPADLEPLDYDHASLFVQRYADADAASAAVGTLFDTVAGREGTYSFGRDDWHRIYYQAGGDVVYAFLIRAGPFVVVAAPSEVAWEERVDWTAALDRLWLWRP